MKRGLCIVASILVLSGCSGGSATHAPSTNTKPTSGGNLAVQGALPAPANTIFSGAQCKTDQVTLVTSGELVIRDVEKGTNWSAEYDNSKGQMIGSLHSGTFPSDKREVIDDYADNTQDLSYAQITLTGKTTGSCVVILSR